MLLFSASRHLAIEAALDPRRPCRHLSAARHIFEPNKSGERGELDVMIGWWDGGASEKVLLSEHTDPLPPFHFSNGKPFRQKIFKKVYLAKHEKAEFVKIRKKKK